MLHCLYGEKIPNHIQIKSMKKTTKIGKAALTALVLFAFAVYYAMIMGFLPKPFSYSLHDLHYPLFNVLCSVLPATVMIIAHRHGFLRAWGLGSRILRGFCYALLCVLPMLVYSTTVSKWNSDSGILFLVNTAVVAGFFEELLFRGFLFGQLFRYAKWGFVPACLTVGLIFGVGHLYQGSSILGATLSAVVTMLGSVFFCWVYVESGYNLWCSIFLHVMMNFVWSAFPVSDSGAVGGVMLNVVRVAAVVIAIVVVTVLKKKRGIPFIVNRHTLWHNA